MTTVTEHFFDFPFEEVRDPNGDYFPSWMAARAAGFDDDQIWSVCESENTWTYGPPHHWINLIGYVATHERHDHATYYHEEPWSSADMEDDNDE